MRCAGPTARHSWSAYRSVQVRALATCPASPLCGSADPISANEHSPVQIQIVAISPNGAILVNVGFLETNFAFLGKKNRGLTHSGCALSPRAGPASPVDSDSLDIVANIHGVLGRLCPASHELLRGVGAQ